MAYPVKTWAKAKSDYEMGGLSIPKLSEKYKISQPAIAQRIRKEGWKKGSLKEAVQEKIELNIIEKFAKIGLPPEKVYEVIKEGMSAEKVSIVGNGEAAMAEVTPDWTSRDKFVTQYNKMTGHYAAEKVDHSGNINYTRIERVIVDSTD